MKHRQPTTTSQASRIDWDTIRQRLETAQHAIDMAMQTDGEHTRRELQARARELARDAIAPDTNDRQLEVVEFVLAEERYAIESKHIRNVHPLEQLTPVPCTPPFVLGIVNLRGEILSIIDIKKFFDLPDRGLTDLNKVIVLETADMRFGILADSIVGVHYIADTDIRPSLPTLNGIREDYLKGVTPERIVILDAEKLLADEDIVIEEEVAG